MNAQVNPGPSIEVQAVKLLGLPAPPAANTVLQNVDFVAKRLTFSEIEQMRARLALDRGPLADIIGISERTYERRLRRPAKSALAGAGVAERALRLARIQVLANWVLEDPDAARTWLNEPQPGLAGRVPNDLLASEFGAREVERLLYRIEHGVYV